MGQVTINTLTTNQQNVNATEFNNLVVPLANEFNGSIDNTNISSSAAIAYSKLNLSGSILNADVSSSAAIAFSKLASLTSGNILVGNGSNVATSVAVSGDITIDNTGAVTIANNAIENAMMADDSVTSTEVDDIFGSWAGKTVDTVYQATVDTIVCALYVPTNAATGAISGITDSNSSPSTVRVKCGQNAGNANVNNMLSITFPVKKNDYWEVALSGSADSVTIYELPIGV